MQNIDCLDVCAGCNGGLIYPKGSVIVNTGEQKNIAFDAFDIRYIGSIWMNYC